MDTNLHIVAVDFFLPRSLQITIQFLDRPVQSCVVFVSLSLQGGLIAEVSTMQWRRELRTYCPVFLTFLFSPLPESC